MREPATDEHEQQQGDGQPHPGLDLGGFEPADALYAALVDQEADALGL